ncbi:uncharacterized protein [Typha latifolia]|uniref:uncharacterized protein n=1 Tax=Typha latifolia TaxID=4733 RepID=UPI003C2B2B0D
MARFFFFFCLLLLFAHGAASQVVGDGDGVGMGREELLGLFEVLGDLLEDPTWAQFHPHPCTDTPWPGIQCEMVQNQDQDGLLHVTRIHIGPDVASPPCKPSAKLSPSLLKLPYLKSFSLFSCFLAPAKVILPPSLFTNASSLEQLVLKSNTGLSGEIPSSLATLANLRVLSLSQNNLHGGVPGELGGLRNLEQLDLSYNSLTGEIPVEIGGLTRLAIFDLSWNELAGEVPSSLGQLHTLQKIDLSFNKLSGRIPPDMGKLDRLVLLDLSYNSLTGPIPETFSELKELQYLLMVNNPIGTRIPLFVGSLRKLAVLGLSGCGLLGPIPSYFASLCNLTALSLDRNSLNGSIPPSLGALPHLGQLNLSQNQFIGEIGFSNGFVSRLGKRLDVRDNKDLCIDPHRYQNLSYYLEAPPCAASSKSSNSSLADEDGVDDHPYALQSSQSSSNVNGSSSCLFWLEMLSIFCSWLFYVNLMPSY